MKKFKLILFLSVQWTWALSQNLVGGIGCLLLALSGKHSRENFHGAVVTYVNTEKSFGGVSIGMFIFMNAKYSKANPEDGWTHDTRVHEFGHCVQSLLLGPLYWIVVALPSVLWCNIPAVVRWRKEKDVSYYALYCEGWANVWGAAWSGVEFVTDEMRKRGRFGRKW